MRETLEFKKVYEKNGQRFYSLSKAVTKAPNPNYDWEEQKKEIKKRLKDDFKHLAPEQIEYVAVSDAHTHIERLLFVAMQTDNGYGCLSLMQLDGVHTFLSHGGNELDVHPDEVYLRRLASANNYNYKLIKG